MASRRSGRPGPVGAPETGTNPERIGGHAAMLAAAVQSLLGGAGVVAVRQLMRAARAGLEPLQVGRRHNRACYLDSWSIELSPRMRTPAMTLPPSGGLMGDSVASTDPARWPGHRA